MLLVRDDVKATMLQTLCILPTLVAIYEVKVKLASDFERVWSVSQRETTVLNVKVGKHSSLARSECGRIIATES